MRKYADQPAAGSADGGLSGAAWERLERLLERFEDAWLRGERPDLADYLAAAEEERRALLVELVQEDLHYRLRAGEPARAEDYLGRFPELRQDREVILDLVAAEYRLRQGDPGRELEDYLRRFPDCGEELRGRLLACAGPRAPAGGNGGSRTPSLPAAAAPTIQDPARATAPAPPAADLRAVPGYELLEELGRGGMGVVYKARQTELNRLVALKMILPGAHYAPELLARFRLEAKAVACLQHPNIVQVYDVGEHNGLPFFALEFIEGGSLDRRIRGTPQPAREAAALVEKLARAVQAAHDRGIVHRDLEPANVLLAADGTPKVTDFGLAKQLDRQTLQTEDGRIMGTPQYMAPEQAWGRTEEVGRLADVYALGVILYELLTGRVPFLGENPYHTLQQVCLHEPVPPRSLQPAVPRDLENVCLKCLEKQQERRYATAAELADDLARWRRGEPVRAQPPSLGYVLGKFVRRYRAPLAAAAAVLLTLVVIVAAAFWQISAAYQKTSTALHQVSGALQREQDAKQEAQDRERDAQDALAKLEAKQSQLARTLAELSESEYRTANVRDSLNWMLQAYQVAPATDPRRAEYRSRLGTQARSLGRPLYQNSPVRAVAFSPDGRLALAGSDDGTTRLWDVATGRPTATLSHRGPVWDAAFSPDGRRLLTGSEDGTARLWDVAAGKALAAFRQENAVRAVAFSPDGRLALTGGGDLDSDVGEAGLWDTATGKRIAPLPQEGLVRAVAFSPDGRLALTGGGEAVRLWETARGQAAGVLPQEGTVRAAAFSPDGSLLLVAGGEAARLWDVAARKEIAVLRHEDTVYAVAFSPNGRLALTGGKDQKARLWETDGGELVATLHHEDAVGAVAFSPDGKLALTGSADRTARLWEAATGKPVGFLCYEGPVHAAAFSADGSLAVTGSQDATARLWQVVPPAVEDLKRPRRLAAWVHALTRKAVNDRGVLEELGPEEWRRARHALEADGDDWLPLADPGRR